MMLSAVGGPVVFLLSCKQSKEIYFKKLRNRSKQWCEILELEVLLEIYGSTTTGKLFICTVNLGLVSIKYKKTLCAANFLSFAQLAKRKV
jgi:hypothetical protein